MTMGDLVKTFNARGSRGRWRAKCPCHKGKSLTLALYDDGGKLDVNCFAGCSKDDILAAVGLTWKDLRPRKEWMPPKEYAALLKQRAAEEDRARNLRIGTWILRFSENGYTREDRMEDVALACLAAEAMCTKVIPAWENILRVRMERIMAANHCMERRMLPEVAKPRKEWTI